jgi:hypothetical protein
VRKRRGKKRSPAIAPLVAKPKLDLELPAEVPISDRERAEIEQHLGFLNRYKQVLRLKLNAIEDRLVNGALAAEDRGVIKHLFKKIDRSVVEQAISREPLKSNTADRARFLAGVVRLEPSLSTLLNYLEALASSTDKKDAARALHLVISRVDFGEASDAQIARIVDLAATCFEGHELTQAMLGFVSSRSFSAAIGRAKDRIAAHHRELLEALSAAERTILRGEPIPEDDAARAAMIRGAERLLSAPEPVLRSLPDEIRRRLAEHAALHEPLGTAVRVLIDSIPHKSDEYAAIALAWSEKLLVERADDRARGVLEQIAQAHPYHRLARDRMNALAWPRLGRVALMPEDHDDRVGIRQGFWLDGSAFVWVRTAPISERQRLEREGELQAKLTTPGVLPALAWGAGDDGTPYVVIGRRGKPLVLERSGRDLGSALDLARSGLLLFKALAREGVELPDADHRRFAIVGRSSLELFDLSGAVAARPEQADVAHAPLAHRWVRSLLADQPELPREVAEVVARRSPLPVLLRIIDRVRARLTQA